MKTLEPTVPVAPGTTTPRSTPHGARRPRVMLFTDSFIHGGTERQLVTALRYLDRARFDMRVGCLKRHGPFLADVQALGVEVVEFPVAAASTWWQWLAIRLQTIRKIGRYLREQQIDVLHAFDFYGNVFAVPAARRAGVPVVLASRRELSLDRGFLQRLAIRYACQRADAVVANSLAAGSTLTGLLGNSSEKSTVVYNGIDPDPFRASRPAAEVRAELGLPPAAFVAGMLAALRPEKRIEMFLRAGALAVRNVPDARFLLIGEGTERARLKSLAHELDIAERTVFAGDRRDVASLLSALDVFVLSSFTESSPNAILEAMAAGLPVVATRVGGIPELVQEGTTGWLVPAGDHEMMATRIVELARDPKIRRRMGAAGRARVEREFAPQQMVQKLRELYEAMLPRRNPLGRVLQITNYPPPMDGWAIHAIGVHRRLAELGVDSRIMDIGPGRRIRGRGCITAVSGLDYFYKLLKYRARGFVFQPHVNGDSRKGYLLALSAVLLGQLTGRPAALMFHAGPSQRFFPRQSGLWRVAFRLLFAASGSVTCNLEPVKRAIAGYGIPQEKVHAAFSVEYQKEEIPVPLPEAIERFLRAHSPRLFSYSLFRPEFTMDVLFEAFARVRRKFPNAGLLVAGPREVPAEAEYRMRELRIHDALLVAGNMPHTEFLTAVKRCDVFVRTHLRDGLCASVLEALELGVPVVAAEDGLRPRSVVTYAPPEALRLEAALTGVLADLDAARARVVRPAVERSLDAEISVLLAAAGLGQPGR